MKFVADGFHETIGRFLCGVESLFLLAISEIHRGKSQSWLSDLHAEIIKISTALEDLSMNPTINTEKRVSGLFSDAEQAWNEILNQQLALSINEKNWPKGNDDFTSGVSVDPLASEDNLELCAKFVQFVLNSAKFKEEIRIDTHRTLAKISDTVHQLRLMGHWAAGPMSCFVSYSSEDEGFVYKLVDDLKENGIKCWFAPQVLKTGNYVAEKIEAAVWTQDKFIVVVSKNALESQWVSREVEAAFERERIEHKNIIIPIRVDNAIDSTISAWGSELRRRRMVTDFSAWKETDNYNNAMKQLADSIIGCDVN